MSGDALGILAASLVARCDSGPANGLITDGIELACLEGVRLEDAGAIPIATFLTAPRHISVPGWMSLLLIAAGLVLTAPWAAGNVVRVSGWRFRTRTGGAWFRIPSLLLVGLAGGGGAAMFAVAVLVLLFLNVGLPWHWPGQWRLFVSLAARPLWALAALAIGAGLVTGIRLTLASSRILNLGSRDGSRSADHPASAPLPRPTPKNILVCCDGTGNQALSIEAGRRTISNVRKLFEIAQSPAESRWLQAKWYDDGVGTETSMPSARLNLLTKAAHWISVNTPAQVVGVFARIRMIAELGFGIGITENIAQGYREIVRQYQPGDRIFLVGFSRGAYTARCIADVIDDIGLLTAEHVRFAPDLIQLYRYRVGTSVPVHVRPGLLHDRAPIAFLGLWDTVASLGVPLWGWSFSFARLWSNAGFGTTDLRSCAVVRHALSKDEQRSQFFPTLFDEPPAPAGGRDVQQRWFRGAHAGVGGGYTDTSLSICP